MGSMVRGDAVGLGLFGRPGQALLEALPGGLVRGAACGRGAQAGHDVDQGAALRGAKAAAQGAGAVQGREEAAAEIRLTAVQAGQAALARRPVAGLGVEQHQAQARVAQAGLDVGQRVLVREQAFHTGKAVPGGRGEAVQEGQVGVEPGQVGGEAQGGRGG